MKLQLQFDPGEISALAGRYAYEDDARVLALGRSAAQRGWFTRDEFLEVAEWKTPRIRSRAAANAAYDIEDATRLALASRDALNSIQVLRRLHGVDWAVASVFLHLAHRDPFPILDYRALEALGVGRGTPMSQRLWLDYVETTRSLARAHDVDKRTLDRALWQWSKERGIQGDTPATTEPMRASGGRHTPPPRRPPTAIGMSEPVDVVILGCVSSKRRGSARAKDLYISPLWRKRRAYAERSGSPWVIYSAKHGILDPEQVIDWYDVALAKLPSSEKRAKGEEAVRQLEGRFGDLRSKTFEIHAGAAYVKSLQGPLAKRGGHLINPVEGLSIGYLLQWYGQQ